MIASTATLKKYKSCISLVFQVHKKYIYISFDVEKILTGMIRPIMHFYIRHKASSSRRNNIFMLRRSICLAS